MSNGATITFQSQRAAIEAELQQRIAAHQRLMLSHGLVASRDSRRPLNLLADGDSWFDYPLSGDLPIASDVIAKLGGLISPRPTILNLAHHGDATTELLGVTKRARLLNALQEPKNGKFDAILFSGGGNDLVGDQFRLWLNDAEGVGRDPAKALNQGALDDIIGVVETAYMDLLAARNLVDKSIPIFVHAYDFARPTANGVCGVGPWLFPSLMSRQWMHSTGPADLAVGAQIVRLILVEFHQLLTKLAETTCNNIVFVETQGTLAPVEWANELHPNPDGFQKIAQKFVEPLAFRFPGRAAQQAIVAASLVQVLPPTA